MSAPPTITTINSADIERAVAVFTAAFIGDPLFRWVYPTASEYLHGFPKLVRAFTMPGFDAGTAYADAAFRGASVWYPPGVTADEEAAIDAARSTVRPDRLKSFGRVMEAIDGYHPRDEPIWYLPVIGVDPLGQGNGVGSALLKHALRECDAQGTRAYLESSNPANLSIYQRHGFEIMGVVEVDSAPPVHPMIRAKNPHG